MRAFLSFADEDWQRRDHLVRHLKPLCREGLVVIDRKAIPLGALVREQIQKWLANADLFIPLVTVDYLGSDELLNELHTAEENRARADGFRIVPILARPCDWRSTLSSFRVLPQSEEPIFDETHDADARLAEVAGELRSLLKGPAAPASPHAAEGSWLHALPVIDRCVGREAMVAEIVRRVNESPAARVAVHGAPGVGKTTVLSAVAAHERVRGAFGIRRFFADLDAGHLESGRDRSVASVRARFFAAVAAAMGLPPSLSERGSVLDALVLHELSRAPALLVLDGLEVPWGLNPEAMDKVLATLAALPSLVLLAGVTGAELPARVAWTTFEVPPLDPANARRLFCDIARVPGDASASEAVDRLIAPLDGLPLAITLLAQYAQGVPIEQAARAWEEHRTTLLRPGWASVIDVARARLTPKADRLLRLLATLPNGIALRGDLDAVFPDDGPVTAVELVHIGLASMAIGRLRMLGPVRDHVAQAPPDEADVARAIDHYAGLAARLGPVVGKAEGAAAATYLSAELGNVDEMIRRGLRSDRVREMIAAAVALSRFARLTGKRSPSPLPAARKAAEKLGDAALLADCFEGLADIAVQRRDEEEYYQKALEKHRESGRTARMARCQRRLGDLKEELCQEDEAQRAYARALEAYRKIPEREGQADCLRALAQQALNRPGPADARRRASARARLEKARTLYREVENPRGEANCLLGLGDVALAQDHFDEAASCYEEALRIHRDVGDTAGEANTLLRQAEVAIERARAERRRGQGSPALDREATGKLLALARLRFGQILDRLGEGNCALREGDVAEITGEAASARASYEEALRFYVAFGDEASADAVRRRLVALAEGAPAAVTTGKEKAKKGAGATARSLIDTVTSRIRPARAGVARIKPQGHPEEISQKASGGRLTGGFGTRRVFFR
ncbi:MAG: tetratricopeptide repeat protein [Minicystis sp.]